ncbi:MAG: hypothetical protein H0X27_05825 [Caulobacteraceae bacterium]|nr:hypothetical protein [Caulobacteraceae bacterium]
MFVTLKTRNGLTWRGPAILEEPVSDRIGNAAPTMLPSAVTIEGSTILQLNVILLKSAPALVDPVDISWSLSALDLPLHVAG